MREMRSAGTRAALMKRYSRLNGDQKRVFDTLMSTVHQKRNMDAPHANGKDFVLQGGAGVRKKYNLSLLRYMEMSRGFLTAITATNGIDPVLHEG